MPSVTSVPDVRVASTNLECDTGNTEDSLCNWIQLKAVNSMFVPMWMGEQLTCAKTAPYLIALSTDFSVDPLISGEYFSSDSSRSWSDDRRASAFTKVTSLPGWAVAKERTVAFVENRNSRDPPCFPMRTASVLLNQMCADWLIIVTDLAR